MIHISTFSGIGGFEVASERMGWTNIATCEKDNFCRRVLRYYWPNAYHHKDINNFTYKRLDNALKKRIGSKWRSDTVILTGGFPCQPYSTAGKRLGKEDERHLWPAMLKSIRSIKPEWVLAENVYGLVNWEEGLVFEEVQSDLEAEGYTVQPLILPACSSGAPHIRYRVFFVACRDTEGKYDTPNTNINGSSKVFDSGQSAVNNTDVKKRRINTNDISTSIEGRQELGGQRELKPSRFSEHYRLFRTDWEKFPSQSPLWSRDDGFSPELSGITVSSHRQKSIEAYGNAVVPDLVYMIFDTIQQYINGK